MFTKEPTADRYNDSSAESSSSTSSLRSSSSSKQSVTSSKRAPQKSFGRQPVRVAASPPVAVETDSTNSIYDDRSTPSLHDLIEDLPAITTTSTESELEQSTQRAEVQALRQEIQELRTASHENDEAWQRDNSRLKDQLASASTREAAQEEKLRICEDQLAFVRQELLDLQQQQLMRDDEEAARAARPPPSHVDDGGSSGLGRERALLKLVVQLVGASNVRKTLRENPNATPEQLCEALVKLRCTQCRHHPPSSPYSNSPRKCVSPKGSGESLHELLFGNSQKPALPRPASPTRR